MTLYMWMIVTKFGSSFSCPFFSVLLLETSNRTSLSMFVLGFTSSIRLIIPLDR